MADDDNQSMFEKAGFSIPKAAPKAGPVATSTSAAPAKAGSMFEAAGFTLPDSKKTVVRPESNIPTPEGFAAGYAAQGNKNPGEQSTLQEIREAISPGTLLQTGASNAVHDTVENFVASKALAGQGVSDLRQGNYLPSTPSLDPSTWSAGGVLKSGVGALGMLSSPVSGAINALIGRPATELTGNPDIGDRANFVANALLPMKSGGKVAEIAAPSTKAVNALVEAVGPENVPAAVAQMRANPRLSVADVSDPVRLTAQGLMAGGTPDVQQVISQAVRDRNATKLRATNTAFTQAMGPSPDVPVMVEGLKERARAAGREAIQPALANAKPVDVSPVLAAIDAQVKPGIQAMLDPGTRLPLSPLQEELVRFRQQLSNPETGETLHDPQKLHEVQSRMGDQAYQLSKSPDPKDRRLGSELRDINEKLIDQIDEASKSGSPKESIVSPAVKFNDKIYTGANHSEALEKAATANGTDIENIHTKADDNKQSQFDAWMTSSGRFVDSKEAAKIAKSPHKTLDSSDPEFQSQKTSGPGPYRQARAKFKDAKDISEAFESGFDTLKNRSGLVGALEDSPTAFRNWMKTATPEEVVARRLGTRADIDQKINSVKNGALAGQTITAIPYNQEKLVALFGPKEANRLIGVMQDAQREAQTNAAIMSGSKTAETTAAAARIKVRDVKGGNPLQYAAPLMSEFLGSQYGIPGVGAAVLGLKVAHLGVQKVGQIADKARNMAFAKNALATGPARESTINALLSHPKVVREMKKSANALTVP